MRIKETKLYTFDELSDKAYAPKGKRITTTTLRRVETMARYSETTLRSLGFDKVVHRPMQNHFAVGCSACEALVALRAGVNLAGAKVGPYTVQSITPELVVIGCHRIPMSEVDRIESQVMAKEVFHV